MVVGVIFLLTDNSPYLLRNLTYTLCFSFLGSWLFCIAGLGYLRKRKLSNDYYRKLFIGLTIVNLFTVALLALVIPWIIIPVILLLLTGAYFIRNPQKPLRLF